jgi:hypothetical protein
MDQMRWWCYTRWSRSRSRIGIFCRVLSTDSRFLIKFCRTALFFCFCLPVCLSAPSPPRSRSRSRFVFFVCIVANHNAKRACRARNSNREFPKGGHVTNHENAGTHFACFTSTKLQILTSEELRISPSTTGAPSHCTSTLSTVRNVLKPCKNLQEFTPGRPEKCM